MNKILMLFLLITCLSICYACEKRTIFIESNIKCKLLHDEKRKITDDYKSINRFCSLLEKSTCDLINSNQKDITKIFGQPDKAFDFENKVLFIYNLSEQLGIRFENDKLFACECYAPD